MSASAFCWHLVIKTPTGLIYSYLEWHLSTKKHGHTSSCVKITLIVPLRHLTPWRPCKAQHTLRYRLVAVPFPAGGKATQVINIITQHEKLRKHNGNSISNACKMCLIYSIGTYTVNILLFRNYSSQSWKAANIINMETALKDDSKHFKDVFWLDSRQNKQGGSSDVKAIKKGPRKKPFISEYRKHSGENVYKKKALRSLCYPSLIFTRNTCRQGSWNDITSCCSVTELEPLFGPLWRGRRPGRGRWWRRRPSAPVWRWPLSGCADAASPWSAQSWGRRRSSPISEGRTKTKERLKSKVSALCRSCLQSLYLSRETATL